MITDPILDLRHRHFTFRRRNLNFIGTWFRSPDNGWRPCMAIVRAGEEYSDQTFPCLIPLERAWIWVEGMGDPREAARSAIYFAQALRLDASDEKVLMRLGTTISDLIGDLISMPPRPLELREAVAEILVTNHATGRSREVVMYDV